VPAASAVSTILHSTNPAAPLDRRAATRMTGVEVATHAELDALLERLADAQDPANRGPVLVQVILPHKDYPRAIGYEGDEHCGPAPP
jgi:hypothetical protein